MTVRQTQLWIRLRHNDDDDDSADIHNNNVATNGIVEIWYKELIGARQLHTLCDTTQLYPAYNGLSWLYNVTCYSLTYLRTSS